MFWMPLLQLDNSLEPKQNFHLSHHPTATVVYPSINKILSIKYIVCQLRGWGFWTGLLGELRPVYKLLISSCIS